MDTKAWYMSKGVWGGIIAGIAGVAGVLGHSVAPGIVEALPDAIVAFVAAVGGLLAAYGRLKATTGIK